MRRLILGTMLLLGGCANHIATLGVVSRQSSSAQPTGRVGRGSDCAAFSHGRIDAAIDEAIAAAGGNALVDVKVSKSYYVLWHCWRVEGTGAVVK